MGLYGSLLWKARRDRDYLAVLDRPSVVYADGASIAWLARLCGVDQRAERMATTDIWPELVDAAARYGYRIALIGGDQGTVEEAAERVRQLGAEVSLVENGYWPTEWEGSIVHRVRDLPHSLVLIGMGAKRQEALAHLCRQQPGGERHLYFTVGGLFDHIVESRRRAPMFWQRHGLEWLWRTLMEPRRLWWRYVAGNSYFLVVTARSLIRHRGGARV